MGAQIDHRLHHQVFVADRPQRTEGGQVDPGHLQPGPLDGFDRGQHRAARSRDQQAGHQAGLRVGITHLRVVQNHLVQREGDDLAGLERQRLGPLLRVQVGNLQWADHDLRIGDTEDDPPALEPIGRPRVVAALG